MNARLGAAVCMYVCKDMQGGWEGEGQCYSNGNGSNERKHHPALLHRRSSALAVSPSLSLSRFKEKVRESRAPAPRECR